MLSYTALDLSYCSSVNSFEKYTVTVCYNFSQKPYSKDNSVFYHNVCFPLFLVLTLLSSVPEERRVFLGLRGRVQNQLYLSGSSGGSATISINFKCTKTSKYPSIHSSFHVLLQSSRYIHTSILETNVTTMTSSK